VRIGVKVSCQDITAEAMVRGWRVADEAGFDHLWVFDHMAGVKARPDDAVFEAWSLLAAMAQATHRIRLGCLVTGNTYRHPAVLAKLAVTVDHLSGGRLEFGIGAAHAPNEHAMFGIEGLDHRLGRLSESLRVMRALWTEDRADFVGRYYRLSSAIANPKPVQEPHPPIWIGGAGPTTLKLAARHADVWNATDSAGDAVAAGKLGKAMRSMAAEEGRDPDAIRWSAQVFWDGTNPDGLLANVSSYLEQGFTEFVIFPDVRGTGADPIAAVTATAHLLPELRRLAGQASPS
jgi:probable F420-dependent oxidoreductase